MNDSVGRYLNETGMVPPLKVQKEREPSQISEAKTNVRTRGCSWEPGCRTALKSPNCRDDRTRRHGRRPKMVERSSSSVNYSSLLRECLSLIRLCAIGLTLGVVAAHLLPACNSEGGGHPGPHTPLKPDRHYEIEVDQADPSGCWVVVANTSAFVASSSSCT